MRRLLIQRVNSGRQPRALAGPPAGDELTAAALAPIGPPLAYQRSLVSVCPVPVSGRAQLLLPARMPQDGLPQGFGPE